MCCLWGIKPIEMCGLLPGVYHSGRWHYEGENTPGFYGNKSLTHATTFPFFITLFRVNIRRLTLDASQKRLPLGVSSVCDGFVPCPIPPCPLPVSPRVSGFSWLLSAQHAPDAICHSATPPPVSQMFHVRFHRKMC